MTQLTTVHFNATPSEREQLMAWLKDEGARLEATEFAPYATTNGSEIDPRPKRYTAMLPSDFKLRAPDWALALIVTP